MKKLKDVVDNEFVKNTKFNPLKTKVNKFENKILEATTLIHINQYNTDKQNSDKKLKILIKNIPNDIGLVTTAVLVKLRTNYQILVV